MPIARQAFLYLGGVCYLIQEIIDKFKLYMRDMGWTQGQAAEEIRISRTHLNKVLNGHEVPSMALLMRMEEKMRG